MARPYALLRAGFPYLTSLGMRRLATNPLDIAIGEEGRIHVLCRGGLTPVGVWRINLDDEDLGLREFSEMGNGQIKWPAALIRDRDENLFVSDESLHHITMLSMDGQFLDSWGEHGEGDGQLNRPSGIAFDAEENIYVVDTMNHRVQGFTKDGKFLLKWGRYGDGDGEFNMPWGITVDELGYVYVVDWRNDRIQKFTADGQFIFKFGTSGSGERQFNRPSGVAVDADGDIYVADRGNNRVQQFDHTGRYVDEFIGDATLGKAARTYILANARPLRFREMTPLGPTKRLKIPTSVRIDDEGRLYIMDYGTTRIQVYKKEAYPLEPGQIAEELRSPSLESA